MNGEFYIWRDSVDKYTFIIGVQSSGGKYVGWTSVHQDGICEMFGDEFAEYCKSMWPGQPVKVSCSFTA